MSMQYPQTSRARLIRPVLIAVCALALLFETPWTARATGDGCHGMAVAEVKGMACPFCAYGLRKHLLAIPGVKNVEVDLNKSQATIETDSGAQVTAVQIQEAINDAGFSPGRIQCETEQKVGYDARQNNPEALADVIDHIGEFRAAVADTVSATN